MATFRKQYLVSRPVYSEDSFQENYDKLYRIRKSFKNHIREYFSCNSEKTKRVALSLLPVIGWMRNYRLKQWLMGDVVSGISTGLVAVMQGLAFSLLASLPASYGLYTAFFPVLTYFLLGTSRHISVGSFPVLSLMVGAVVTRLVPDPDVGDPYPIPAFKETYNLTLDQKRVLVASSVTFLMGILQLGMGLLQFGFIVLYLSDTLVSGFTTAAAIHILVSQLKFILGLNVPGINGPLAIIYTLEKVFVQITSTNICDLVMSIVIMAAVFLVKELNERYRSKLPVPIPIEVIMTIIACGISYGFDFEKTFKVQVVGEMVSGYEAPVAPDLDIMREGAAEAFPIAVVGFAVAFSVAKVYSLKHDYIIDGNQELIAFGVSNMFGATFRSFAASTALSRSAVQESSGGKTQIAGLVSALIVMIVTVALSFLLAPLPKSVLGALVIVNLKGMLMQFREVCFLWRRDKIECVVWVGTCVAAIFLGLDLGLAVGLGVELLTVVFRAQFPRCCVLANIPGTDFYRDRKDYPVLYEPPGVKIFRIPSPIFFANVDFFRNKLIQAVGFSPTRVLKKRNKALIKIKKLLNQQELHRTENGLLDLKFSSGEEDGLQMENIDSPSTGELSSKMEFPFKWDGRSEQAVHLGVPTVTLHSLLLDFSAVSFLDISALKGLKAVIKEFLRLDVQVYIVSCDENVLEKFHQFAFFDHEIRTSIFFPSLHDAVLHAMETHGVSFNHRVVCKSTHL